jgi:hypothetical protein
MFGIRSLPVVGPVAGWYVLDMAVVLLETCALHVDRASDSQDIAMIFPATTGVKRKG